MSAVDYQRYLCSREWGLRRQAVASRSGGICERCRKHPAAAVHHLTYARKFNEPLDDLIHVCSQCHKYIHGKSDHDPAELHVYVAGPVVEAPDDHSISIVTRWRDEIFGETKHGARFPGEMRLGRFVYWGPLIAGDHGLAYNDHALDSSTHEGSGDEHILVDRCLNQVDEADLVFAWIDRKETVGTICEIASAYSARKPLFVAFSDYGLSRYFYFCARMADNNYGKMVFESATLAWAAFVDWVPARLGFQQSHFSV